MTFHLRSGIAKALNRERSVAITTKIGCVNQCSYCPQSVFVKAYRLRSQENTMSIDTFKKCIDHIPARIIISFAGFSEPWQNPECSTMLLYAHQHGHQIRVNTSCIGMSPEDLQRISMVPFKKFVIHLPDAEGHSKIKVDQAYLELIERLAAKPMANMMWKFHRTGLNETMHPQVLSVLQHASAPIKYFGLSNRAGSVKIEGRPEMEQRAGVFRRCNDYHHNILFPNGDVGLCHMDWGLNHIIGNLISSDYASLYKGAEFKRILRALRDDEEPLHCRYCEKGIVKASLVQRLIPGFLRHGHSIDNLYDE